MAMQIQMEESHEFDDIFVAVGSCRRNVTSNGTKSKKLCEQLSWEECITVQEPFATEKNIGWY